MQVRSLMKKQSRLATVRADDTLRSAAKLMRERECGALPVLDEEAKLVGIVTDRDICMAAQRLDEPLSRIRVESAMTSPVHICGPGDTIERAEHLMGLHQVRRLPVVDSAGALVGILSLDDIAKEANLERNLIIPAVTASAVGNTLGQISRPHLVGPDSAEAGATR